MNNRKRQKQFCAECGAAFMPWDEMYSWTDGRHTSFICGDCFDALFDELSRYERAALVGSVVIQTDNSSLLPS